MSKIGVFLSATWMKLRRPTDVALFVALLTASGTAYAAGVTLPSIDDLTEKVPSVNPDPPRIECSNILDELQKYNEMVRQEDQALTVFLEQVSDKIASWYVLLKPLEGKTDAVPIGTFTPLDEGAKKVGEITGLAIDNAAHLSVNFDNIIESLQGCSIVKN